MDSAVLLKSGHKYRDLGQISGTACDSSFSREKSPSDNFAKAVETAMGAKGDADALIALMDVTTATHRGNYFPIWLPIPIPLPIPGATAVELPEVIGCTSVSGTAIEFIVSLDCTPGAVHREGRPTWLRPEASLEDQGEVAVVASLQPTLKWERAPPCWRDVTYDLIVWRGEPGGRSGEAQVIVYERQGVTDRRVQLIETVLEPETHYLWAVRAHFKLNGETQISPWTYEIGVGALDEPRHYHFLTPAAPSVSQ